jgi:hypothetical protein
MRGRGGDLFDLFPELPHPRREPRTEQLARVRESVERMQLSVRRNVEHQRAAAAEVKAKWSRGLETRRRRAGKAGS